MAAVASDHCTGSMVYPKGPITRLHDGPPPNFIVLTVPPPGGATGSEYIFNVHFDFTTDSTQALEPAVRHRQLIIILNDHFK